MSRDLQDEHRQAVEGLKLAQLAYARCLTDCRERLAAKRAWVRECERRCNVAGQAVKRGATRGRGD